MSEKDTLDQLISLMEPVDAVPRMACILQGGMGLQTYFSSQEKINEEIKRLAEIFAANPDLLEQLFSKLGNKYFMAGDIFGRKLAESEKSDTFAALWPSICKVLDKDLSIAVGYLNVKYNCDKEKAIFLLDELENTDKVSQAVRIHSILECSGRYLQHVLKLLSDGTIDLNCVSFLRYSIISNEIKESEILDFLLKIKDMKHGSAVALDIFWQYCESVKRNKNLLSLYAKAVGRIIIIEGIKEFEPKEGEDLEYKLEELIELCFSDNNVSKEEIKNLFVALKDFIIVKNTCGRWFWGNLMYPVARLYVKDFLDIVVGDEKGSYELEREIRGHNGIHINIIDNIDPESVFLWANSRIRRFRVARLSSGFQKDKNGQYQWTELAKRLLHTQDGKQILEQFVEKIPPTSWSGSRSKITRERLTLLQELESDKFLGNMIRTNIIKLEKEIGEMEIEENRRMRDLEKANDRFEF